MPIFQSIPALNGLMNMKSSLEYFKECKRKFLLKHCPNSSLSIFYNSLETFLSTFKMFDKILCDFNINIVANNNNLQQVMSQYQLIHYETKQIIGSVLDHVLH